jgi:hypothetical protein
MKRVPGILPQYRYSPSRQKTELLVLLDPFSEGPMSPEAIAAKQLMDDIIPEFQRKLDEANAKTADLAERLRQQEAANAQLRDQLINQQAAVDPDDAAVFDRLKEYVVGATGQGVAVRVEPPGDEPPSELVSVEFPAAESDGPPVVDEPAEAKTDAVVEQVDTVALGQRAETFASDMLKGWFDFGVKVSKSDAAKIELLRAVVIEEVAYFTKLQVKGDAGAPGAIAQSLRSIPSVSRTLGLHNLTATREKMERDLESLKDFLISAARAAAVGALA